jgi:hypothetical protein
LTLDLNLHNNWEVIRTGEPRVNSGTIALLCFIATACGLPAVQAQPDSKAEFTSQEALLYPRAGDIILVPLNCYVCNAIESETGTPYSHAVVVANTVESSKERFVFEAWGTTRQTPFTDILKRKQKNQPLFLLRPKNFRTGRAPDDSELSLYFENNFAGLAFDDEYLWDNADAEQKEKLYCTEFVIKFINAFIKKSVQPQPMDFSKNAEFWKKYYGQFSMSPPSGKSGASPATLYFSREFVRMGELPDE